MHDAKVVAPAEENAMRLICCVPIGSIESTWATPTEQMRVIYALSATSSRAPCLVVITT